MTPKVFLFAFMGACSPSVWDSSSPDGDWWSCEHVETQFSAFVVAEATTSEDWSSIQFMIYDNDQFHSLKLIDYGGELWRVDANLLDLDCHSDGLGGDFAYHE
jgi:hypothetical protein